MIKENHEIIAIQFALYLSFATNDINIFSTDVSHAT